MNRKIMSVFLLLLLGTLSACATQDRATGRSEVREERAESDQVRQRDYGNPPAADDWEQRGASGYPANNAPPDDESRRD